MAEHKYAQVLRWIADGVPIQWQRSSGEWIDQDSQCALKEVVCDDWHPERYRIKPKTVKIGNREVEAPVLNPAKGQRVYAVWPDGMQSEWAFRNGDFQHEEMAADGFFYSTQDAANAAREAITALLTGKE